MTDWYEVYDKMSVVELLEMFSDRVEQDDVPSVASELVERIGEDILRDPAFASGLVSGLVAGMRIALDPDVHLTLPCMNPEGCDQETHPFVAAAYTQDVLIYNIAAVHLLFDSYRAIDELEG